MTWLLDKYSFIKKKISEQNLLLLTVAAWRTLWPQERKRQRSFFLFGLALIIQLNNEGIQSFFEAFFRVPKWYFHFCPVSVYFHFSERFGVLNVIISTKKENYNYYFFNRMWRGFLGSTLSSADLILFSFYMFAIAPNQLRMNLVRHLLSDPTGSTMIKTYLTL